MSKEENFVHQIADATGDERNTVQSYFQNYPGFVYEPSERAAQQFSRLVIEKGWRIGSHEFFIALAGLNDALLMKFDPSNKRLEVPVESVVSVPELGNAPELGFDTELEVGVQQVGTQDVLKEEKKEQEKRDDEKAREPRGKGKRRKERREQRKQGRVQAVSGSEDPRQIASTEAVSEPSDSQPHTSNQVGSNGTNSTSRIGPPSFLDTSGPFDNASSGKVMPNYLDAFFGEFSEFNAIRDRTESVSTQLVRLREQKDWRGPRKFLWDIALERYKEALVLQFNGYFGTDTEDLRAWHRVLWIIGDELPNTVEGCKRLIDSIHVNIVDLVDASVHGTRHIQIFDSVKSLSEYTIETGRFFPKEDAKAGGVLRYLLRRIRKVL